MKQNKESNRLKDDFSFITGAVRTSDIVYLALTDDSREINDDEHSIPLLWHNGIWKRIESMPTLDWIITGICVVKNPINQGMMVGIMGQVLCMGSGDLHIENILDGNESPQARGPLRSATTIEDKIYAVGMGRQVYRRDARDQWVALDRNIRPDKDEAQLYGFDSIDGFTAKELYTAGVYGEIWRFDGEKWLKINSPTNLILSKVCCAEDGKVYIGGQKAILIRGRYEKWEIIPIDNFTQDIWGMAWYKGKLYITTLNNLYTLESDDTLVPVDMGKDRASTFYHLSSADGVLWSIGRKDIMAFDGRTWTRIE